jgi:hypothetical protein
MYSVVYSVLQNAPCTLLEMACSLMARVESTLYSGCTLTVFRVYFRISEIRRSGVQHGIHEVRKKYIKYKREYIKVQFDQKRSHFDKKRSMSPGKRVFREAGGVFAVGKTLEA